MPSQTYKSHKWVMLEIVKDVLPKPLYVIFYTLINPLTRAEVDKLNMVKSVSIVDGNYNFVDYSNNIVICEFNSYGTTSYSLPLLNQKIQDTIKSNTSTPVVMPSDTNFLELNY